MGLWRWCAVLWAGLCAWLGPWAAAEAALRCAALAGLGLGSVCGGWALGRHVRKQRGGFFPLLFRAELRALHSGLRSAQPGPQRLAALRRLAAFTRGPVGAEAWWWEIRDFYGFRGSLFPEQVLVRLADCLLKWGSEAAPLVLASLVPLSGVSSSFAASLRSEDRELFFSDASLASLRRLFLSSQDPTLDKALLRLFAYASRGLTCFQWNAPRMPPAIVRVGQDQLFRHQDFLRDPGVLGKLRGLLSGGDQGELIPDAMATYSGMVGGEPAANPYPNLACCHFSSFGWLFLFRPILGDIIRHWEELQEASRRALSYVRFRLSPLDRPTEAREVVEGVLLPLLDQAHLLPPHLLGWLTRAFPTAYEVGVLGWPIPQQQIVKPFDCEAGRELRGKLLRGVCAALLRLAGCPDKTWALLAGLWSGEPEPLDGHSPETFPSILIASVQAICDAERDWRDAAVNLALQMNWDSRGWEASELVALSGGFKALRRLLDHHTAPFTGRNEFYFHQTDFYGSKLNRLLVKAVWLLQPQQPPFQALDPMVEGATKVKRLVCWEDQGLGPVLRRLVEREPEAGAFDLRPSAQAILNTHHDLSLDQPVFRPSTIPHAPIPFTLH